MKIGPSIMCANLLRLQDELNYVSQADWLHIDIMDGYMVPDFTFGIEATEQILNYSSLKSEIHLMSKSPLEHVEQYVKLKPDIITFHPEVLYDPLRVVYKLKEAGIQTGIAINPSIPIVALNEVIHQVDRVIIMGVNPGFIGQKLLKASLTKSLHLADIIKQKGLNTDIILDGGVKLENLKEIYEHKVDGVVVGTGIFHHNLGTEAALKAFKHTAKELHKEGQYH